VQTNIPEYANHADSIQISKLTGETKEGCKDYIYFQLSPKALYTYT
jgi:hypothetical protein